MTSTLLLLRYGESTWSQENRRTGCEDVRLSARGIDEAKASGSATRDAGLAFDLLHSSLLRRAVATANIALDEISDEEIAELNIPTGIPLKYEVEDDLRVISTDYIGDTEAADTAADAVARKAG